MGTVAGVCASDRAERDSIYWKARSLCWRLEGPWPGGVGDQALGLVSLSFVNYSLGGTGYLRHAADEFHLVAQHALEHLDHTGCETAAIAV